MITISILFRRMYSYPMLEYRLREAHDGSFQHPASLFDTFFKNFLK